MPASTPRQLTELLIAWSDGDQQALDELSRSSTTNCATSRGGTCAASGRATPSRPRRWSTQVVELRYFGGLSNEEVAEVLKIHPNIVMRDWSMARAWLYKELSREGGGELSTEGGSAEDDEA
jgi:hypothetical protein